MTSSQGKCGLSSLLPMSCRERAEAFANRLHSRLRSLSSEEVVDVANERSWLTVHENSLTLSQPRHASDLIGETDLDLGTLESPVSPDEELDATEFERLLNKDNFTLFHDANCQCSTSEATNINILNNLKNTQFDSDSSDGPFYDSRSDLNQQVDTEQISCVPESDVLLKPNETQDSNESIIATVPDCAASDCTLAINGKILNTCVKEESILECDNCLPPQINCEEFDETNIQGNSLDNDPQETYTTCLTVEKTLTVECPNDIQVVVTSSQLTSKNVMLNGTTEEDTESEERTPRVRRCSSLKTGKTPPGTPGQKKIVRFADVLGLDLADVRTFLDEIPKIPNSAYNDLRDMDLKGPASEPLSRISSTFGGRKADNMLVPLFQQPGGLPNFIDRVREGLVCLENALVEDSLIFSISGIVRVKNVDFHKSVHIRYTLDSWQTFADVQATYMENSCDGFSDKFSFLLFANNLLVGRRLEFAIRFQCRGCQYWDNNNGKNYCFQCMPVTTNTSCTPLTIADDSWSTTFY